MPKTYTEQERAYIKNRLKEEAGKCLTQYGIRRTTVDEIVKRVSIPKGTFYLFYKSKEILLFEVILEQHDLIEQKMKQAINEIDIATITAHQLTDVLLGFYQMSAKMPILKLLNSEDIELMALKLPQELLTQHFNHDDSMIEKIFAALPIKPGVKPQIISSAFRCLYLTMLNNDELGETNFDETLRVLIFGLVTQII